MSVDTATAPEADVQQDGPVQVNVADLPIEYQFALIQEELSKVQAENVHLSGRVASLRFENTNLQLTLDSTRRELDTIRGALVGPADEADSEVTPSDAPSPDDAT